jgi:hypothetical protein
LAREPNGVRVIGRMVYKAVDFRNPVGDAI